MVKKFTEINQRKMNVNGNPKTLKFQQKDVSILDAFTVSTEEYYPNCYNVNDAKDLQILYYDCKIILPLEVKS